MRRPQAGRHERELSFVRRAQHAGFDRGQDINPAVPQTLHNRFSYMLVYIVANTTHPSAPQDVARGLMVSWRHQPWSA
jgi:hypothetical protein